jgi:outer membrane protein TolC
VDLRCQLLLALPDLIPRQAAKDQRLNATPEFGRWWDSLHDPQLSWFVERALAGNPDIEIALTRVQEARLQQNVVLGAMLPTVAGSGGIATGSAGDLMRGRAGQTLRAGDSTHGFRAISRMAGFDASWELDLFGKVQRSLEAAVDDTEAQIDLRNAVQITVIADVARNYFEIRGLQIRLEIARKDVAEAKRTIELVTTRLEHGASNKSDLAPATDESDATSTKPGVRVRNDGINHPSRRNWTSPWRRASLSFSWRGCRNWKPPFPRPRAGWRCCSAPTWWTSPGPFVVL